jgi:SAM-dependent methyltransferase
MSDNDEQIAYWNGEGGERWVRQNAQIDAIIRPIGEATLDAAAVRAGERAIDIGCGCGNQTLALAGRIGSGGQVLGVDVSGPMIGMARELAAARQTASADVDFLQADAASHAFERGARDLLFSRFGVMFFADPVAAFANLRLALRPAGRLAFCCWRAMRENELMSLPMATALEHLPAPEAPPPGAPGPFAFADPARVQGILEEAGYIDCRITALDVPISIGAGSDASGIASQLLELGPAARLLSEATPAQRQAVTGQLASTLSPRVDERGITLMACCWLVRARRP